MVKATPTKSRTPFYGMLLLLAIAGGSSIWYAMQASKQKPLTLDAASTATLPKAEGYLRGDPNAAVTIMEFGDFECPQCGRFATLAEPDLRTRIIDAGLANFRYFDFPLPMHQNTLAASLAASCAADQGKFWEMHDAIFAGQFDWNTQATSNPRKFFDGYAQQLGLDMEVYGECVSSQKNMPRIQANQKAGADRGVNGTPTIIIGNQVFPGSITADEIKHVVDSLNAALPKAPKAADSTKK